MLTAAGAVFSTYELMEEMLLHLPLPDLFILQRVSSTWQCVAKRSEAIRRKMFLLPRSTPLRPSEGQQHIDPAVCLQLNPAFATKDLRTQ